MAWGLSPEDARVLAAMQRELRDDLREVKAAADEDRSTTKRAEQQARGTK